VPNNENLEFILPTAERTILVTSGERGAHLTYWRRRGAWECVGTSYKLEYLSITPITEIESTLTKLRMPWKWHNPPDDKIMKRSLEYKRKHGGVF
jgi:hypothetical protein